MLLTMSHPDDRLLPGPGRARICGSGARGGDGEDLQAVTPVFLRVTLWHMCNKHFRSSAKCIENSKKGRSKYISVKSHMTSFTKFEDGLYEPDDLDLVYQGGNLTGAETCPYPVHIWQGGIIERPVAARRGLLALRRFELLSRSGLAGTPLLLLAANRFYRCQPGWRPVTQAASYQALPHRRN